MAARLTLYATTTRGTEPLLAKELEALGAAKVRQDRGGVRFSANIDELTRIVINTRIAMRVLYPLGTFEVEGKEGLYTAARNVPWEDWLTKSTTFAVEATLKDSEHTHSGFVALQLKDGIVDRLRETLGGRPDVDTRHPDVQVVAHLSKKQLSLSLDVCGEPLTKRGYRVLSTPAPMKETLAAAMLVAAGYTGEEPFLDPMCGSGTLAIEAALIATHRAPGLKRHFAMERWPSMKDSLRALMDEARREAEARIRKAPFPLIARDRDEEALAAVKRNASAASLGGALVVEEADALKWGPPDCAPGLIATNPPYGDRLTAGGQKGMKSFYFKLGDALDSFIGWRVAVLAGNEAFESAFHHRPLKRMPLWNGPIECQLITYPAMTGGLAAADPGP